VENGSTKTRILDRAYQLGARYGLEAVTIGRLADEMAMSKAGLYGHFGSKQELQLQTLRHGRAIFLRDVIAPTQEVPDGVERLWASCLTVLAASGHTGLPAGDFWVTVFHEYAARSGPVREAAEATMRWWLGQLEHLVAVGLERGQLAPCDPAQLAFEVQALLGASSHQYHLCHDTRAVERGLAAIAQRLETLRGASFPPLLG
jgi:AcrR family transcriptional regulator